MTEQINEAKPVSDENDEGPHIEFGKIKKYDTENVGLLKGVSDYSYIDDALIKRTTDCILQKLLSYKLYHRGELRFNLKLTSTVKVNKLISSLGVCITSSLEYTLIDCNGILIRTPSHSLRDRFINYIYFNIFAKTLDEIEETKVKITSLLTDLIESKIPSVSIQWYTFHEGREVSYHANENLDDIVFPESYPYIENMDQYINNFICSQSPVLVLRGSHGTGKTRFIRYILRKMAEKEESNKVSAMFTSSKDIIESGNIYLKLVFDDTDVLILEDIDYHMQPRKDGNVSMYNLLSTSSGLLSNAMKRKKIILSTNLPNTKNIDDALLRPGRCFGVLETRRLNEEEAMVLSEKLGIAFPKKSKDYSIAELYNSVEGCEI